MTAESLVIVIMTLGFMSFGASSEPPHRASS